MSCILLVSCDIGWHCALCIFVGREYPRHSTNQADPPLSLPPFCIWPSYLQAIYPTMFPLVKTRWRLYVPQGKDLIILYKTGGTAVPQADGVMTDRKILGGKGWDEYMVVNTEFLCPLRRTQWNGAILIAYAFRSLEVLVFAAKDCLETDWSAWILVWTQCNHYHKFYLFFGSFLRESASRPFPFWGLYSLTNFEYSRGVFLRALGKWRVSDHFKTNSQPCRRSRVFSGKNSGPLAHYPVWKHWHNVSYRASWLSLVKTWLKFFTVLSTNAINWPWYTTPAPILYYVLDRANFRNVMHV